MRALGLGLMVAVFVGTVEGAANDGDKDDLSILIPIDTYAIAEFRSPADTPKNVIIFRPAPNIEMLFPSLDDICVPQFKPADSGQDYLVRADVVGVRYFRSRLVCVRKVSRQQFIEHTQTYSGATSASRSKSAISPFHIKIVPYYIFRSISISMPPFKIWIRNYIGPNLPLAYIASNVNGGARSLGGPERRLSSSAGFTKGAPQENNRPNANARCDNPERRHDPLCKRILRRDEGAPIKNGLLRLMLFGGLVVAFGIAGGKFSLWGFDRRNDLVFYGGIAGAVFLSLFSGFLIFTYPLWLSFLP